MSEHHTMSDFEVALMDAIKTVMEVLVAKRIIGAVTLDEMLERQGEQYPPREMPGARFVMQELRRVLNDPERARMREFLQKPSEGSA
jgi:hypothetical protein